MDEYHKNKIVELWNSQMPIDSIVKMFCLPKSEVYNEIRLMKKQGLLDPTVRKSKVNTTKIILDVYNSGVHYINEIADKTNYSYNYVRNILLEHGIHAGRSAHNFHERKPTDVSKLAPKTQAIIKALEQGTRASDIVKQFGCSRQYVNVIKHKYVNKEGDVK